jgi:DNA-directed RNA polymerase subunit N (RpoN/RPB10)
MIIPVRCYTCNKLLADKYHYYESELLKRKLRKEKEDENEIQEFEKKQNIKKEDEKQNINDITIDNIFAKFNNLNINEKNVNANTNDINQNKNKSKSDKDPLIININDTVIKKTIAGEIMDELGLIRICCRKIMLTSINIVDEI